MNPKIVILGTDCDSTWIVANFLHQYFEISAILIEEKVSKFKLIKNRIKKLGYLKVFGQLCFQIFLYPIICKLSQKRIAQICQSNNLDVKHDKLSDKIIHIKSINDIVSAKLITELSYDIVVINGTRILSEKLINSIKIPIINTHVGITPKYRGVHGGYWALANNDPQNCGVTVHLVDSGIDTGRVLNQARIKPSSRDNFSTYPYLQIVAALPLIKESIHNPYNCNAFGNNESILWYHPTLLEYLFNFIFKSIK